MKKVFFITTLGLALFGLGLVTTSCSTDGLEEKSVGELDRDWGVNDLPKGYRVKNVGNIRYVYKTNGKLDVIRIDGKEFDTASESIKLEKDNGTEKYDLTFNYNNLITKVKYTIETSGESYSEKGEGTIKLSYTSDKQLDEVTSTYHSEGTDEGKKYTFDSEYEQEYSYNGKRLRRVKKTWKDDEASGDEKHNSRTSVTIGFDYDDDTDYLNRYYQWTPNMVQYVMGNSTDGIFAALSYLGVFGRASSQLPEKIIWDETGTDSEEGDFNHSETYRCRYDFNTYDAIRMADNVSYTYTEKDDEYQVKAAVGFETRPAETAVAPRNSFITRRGKK